MPYEQTEQQAAACAAFRRGESLAMRAVAGSGKTATLVSMYQDAPIGALALAFNRKNAEDLAKKMPAHVVSRTMNSLGHRAWMKHLGRKVTLDTRKSWTLWNTYPHAKELAQDAADIVKLVGLAKSQGLTSGFASAARPDLRLWADLAEQFDIEGFDSLAPHAAWLLHESAEKAFAGLIDFDDQIYMPCTYGSPFDRFPCLAVDEAQDLSPLQHQMVARSLRAGGQIVVVGDPNQAIYSFRGASSTSFDQLVQRFALPIMPLTASFRCPRAVVREAQRYVPDIIAAGEREGTVLRTAFGPKPALNETVLCRYNAPLVKLAFKSIKARIAVQYLGRDFLSGLKSLHKKYPTPKELEGWYTNQIANARTEGAVSRANDRYESLSVLHEEGNVDQALTELLEAPKANAFTLSTIHKAKGLEWHNVTYLGYDKPDSSDQADNIRYVGVTRAQDTLTLVEGA